jgi:phage/plasmid-like protein (TIGR03299 family)
MSHDIDTSTGKAAIAYVGEKPWHGLGQELQRGAPIEVWLKAAQLDWSLKRLPVQYLVDGKLRTMDDRFVLVRDDTNDALSIVSSNYQIVQPKEVVEFYRDLVDAYGYTLETAGALNGGRKVWALAKTGRTGFSGNDSTDEVAAYILLATSCDKTLATTAAFTSIRVVCQNTLFFALDDIKGKERPHVKVPHNHRFDADRIKHTLGLVDVAWEAFMRKVTVMTTCVMQAADASRFFEKVLGKKEDAPLPPKIQRELATINALFHDAPGQKLAATKDTLWGGVNAVTYYADHVRKGTAGERLDSAWFGSGSALKDRAWLEANKLLPAQSADSRRAVSS